MPVGTRHVVTAVRVRLRTATFSGYARLRTARSEGGARLRTVEQHFNRAYKWAEMLRHPCILGDPQQRAQSKKKKRKRKKKFPAVPLILPVILQIDPPGFGPRTFQLQGTALPLG